MNSKTSPEQQFYQRNFEASGALTAEPVELSELGASDRYFHVLHHIAKHRPRHCAELGYGGPRYINILAALSDHVTLIDIVDRKRCIERSNVDFIQHNLNDDLPLSQSSLDAVVALMIVEHLFDPFHSVREIARVLREDGWLYLNVPLVTGLKNRLRLLGGRLPITSRADWYEIQEWDGGHLHYFTLPLVMRLLRDSGFGIVVIHPVGKLTRIKRLLPTLLCSEITLIAKRLKHAP